MTHTLPNAVLWDWDGTIADTYSFLNDAHNHTLTTLGFPTFKEGEYQQYFGKPREMLYPAIYKDKADKAIDIFGEYVFENADQVQPIDGVREVLTYLKEQNIPMGIVSNKKSDYIQEELKHTQMKAYFQIVIGSGDAQADKPSGAPLMLALEQMKIDIDKENIWYVGDTENDLACAQECGAKTIFLCNGDQGKALVAKYRPYFDFTHYNQLKEFLVAI